MTDLTPTPQQLQNWVDKLCHPWDQGVGPSHKDKELACLAFKAGADQELAECCEWLAKYRKPILAADLKYVRRPKPPSLKEQALEVFEALIHGDASGLDVGVIRRALEALPNG
jgi:hypothetical protein